MVLWKKTIVFWENNSILYRKLWKFDYLLKKNYGTLIIYGKNFGTTLNYSQLFC